MRSFALSAATIALALTLSACGEKEGAALEKGQVLATVNGTDVTTNELNAELVGAQLPAAGEQRKAVEQQALQGLVDRTILADIARERGIDKSPVYIAQKRRAEENLLVQILQREIASKISATTPAEAKSFMESNPVLFAERKIYQLDQIQFQVPKDLNKLKAYEPFNTMEEIALQLTRDGLAYRRAPGSLDPAGTNPAILKQLLSRPEGEIFIIPANGALVATRIIGSKPEPLTGPKAEQYAMSAVQQKKIAEATEKDLAERIKKARESVKYQEGYAPPKPPAGAPAAAPAAPAPTGG
jgi:peptidyl-prolyl cis-trans isomerase C